MVGVVVLLSVCDVTMLQLMPWRQSYFYKESKGFPTFSLMKFCLGIDAVATVGSVTTQILFLNNTSNVDNPATSDLAKAVFALNIAFSIMGAILGLMFMYLKGELLRSADKMDGGGSSSSSSSSGAASDGGSAREAPGAPKASLDHAMTENPLSLAESGGSVAPEEKAAGESDSETEGETARPGSVHFSVDNPMLQTQGGAAPSASLSESSLGNFGAIAGRNTLGGPRRTIGGFKRPSAGAGPPPPPPRSRATLGGGAPLPPPPPPERPSTVSAGAEDAEL